MTKQEFQTLLDEQNKGIKCDEIEGQLVVINNLIIGKTPSRPFPSNLVKIVGGIEIHKGAAVPDNFLPNCQSVGGGIEIHEGAAVPDNFLPNSKQVWGKKSGDTHNNVLYADGMYTLVKPPFHNKKLDLTIYKPYCVGVPFVVTNGEYWAHGETFDEAYDDLAFKQLETSDKDDLRTLDLNQQRPIAEAQAIFRVVTRACLWGVKAYKSGIEVKETYSISDMMALPKDSGGFIQAFIDFYGSE